MDNKSDNVNRSSITRILSMISIMFLLVVPASSVQSTDREPPDVESLLDRLDELYESSGTRSTMEITIVRPRKTRTMKLKSWSKGQDKALIIVQSPPRDAGTATLKVGDNLWNYLPKISRTIRVPPSMMMGSWMGSDITNDDIVRDTSYREDYDYELIGWSEDPPGWQVQLIAKPDLVGLWNRVEFIFSPETGLPTVARHYDRKDRLSRSMKFENVKTIDGRTIPTLVTIIPEQEEGKQSSFEYTDIEFDVEVDEGMFSLSQLERKH